MGRAGRNVAHYLRRRVTHPRTGQLRTRPALDSSVRARTLFKACRPVHHELSPLDWEIDVDEQPCTLSIDIGMVFQVGTELTRFRAFGPDAHGNR